MSDQRKASATMSSRFGEATDISAAPYFAYLSTVVARLTALPADETTGGRFKLLSAPADWTRLHVIYDRPAQIDPLENVLRSWANLAFKGRFTLLPRAEFTLETSERGLLQVNAFVRLIDRMGRTSAESMAYHQLNYLALTDDNLRGQLEKHFHNWAVGAFSACPDMKDKAFQSIVRQIRHEPTGRKLGEA